MRPSIWQDHSSRRQKPMKKIVILGAGRSATACIRYLLDRSAENGWTVTVGDLDLEQAERKIGGHSSGEAVPFDIKDRNLRQELLGGADCVISLLPARMHPLIARTCLDLGKHLVTASYVSDSLRRLHSRAKKKGLVFLNEVGLDPGIDHMSAMRIIDRIKEQGGRITCFDSSTGGLIAPASDDNPWHYKFTWNPRNVILAGHGGARFLHHDQYKFIPYHQLFKRTEIVSIPGWGDFEIYGNRDSLKYQQTYGLENISTMFRGTIRRPGFCESWDIFVQMGMTDDSYFMNDSETMTYREYTNRFMKFDPTLSVEEKLERDMGLVPDSAVIERLRWTGIFDDKPIGLKKATPAHVLQHLLEEKWSLKPDDRDMIVMLHRIGYTLQGEEHGIVSHLVVEGEDPDNTAMSKTVGLPVAIAARLIMENKVKSRGVLLPLERDIYDPILDELKEHGIRFIEEQRNFFI